MDALEALQRQCPMSMAVTLRHYSQVHQAVQSGAPASSLALQHHTVGIPVALRHCLPARHARCRRDSLRQRADLIRQMSAGITIILG